MCARGGVRCAQEVMHDVKALLATFVRLQANSCNRVSARDTRLAAHCTRARRALRFARVRASHSVHLG